MNIPYFDSTAVRTAAPWTSAIQALEQALLTVVDPEDDSPRLFSPAPNGEFLLMPATNRQYSGIKALTVAPANPARGLEKIQGVYVLFDSDTSTPLATMDGNELTAIRTPATTLLAIKHILASTPRTAAPRHPGPTRVLVFGAGVQALNHLRATHAVLPEASLAVVGRRPERVTALIGQLAAEGLDVRHGTPAEVAEADVVICATSSRTPLFDGGLVAPCAVVAAVGQHGLDAREVDANLVRHSDVVVEGRASALREAGDLIPARSAEEWEAIRPANLRDLVKGEFVRSAEKPCLYSGVGMAWEDLVIAGLVYEGGTRS
ncbi:ornithine cyclodeaminase family protein [Arthrobacter globiformis]|uniref:ornithine cyclodeaminase family protein n=1 Tax=Arthrobacter globiformis TaxID=1665 RepID=UPI0027904C58|nr:ornithine cyclodeaminase family protein [Arthrobacter globiformis]MDQ0618700.1 1-piperideine-2-carboxylate/1-pyrroline-2-carboxylate reductase [NAD(P)H] [Arthrobacter globiformis]